MQGWGDPGAPRGAVLRAGVASVAVLVAAAGATACGWDDTGDPEGALGADQLDEATRADGGASVASADDDQELRARSYQPGDCVTWKDGRHLAETHVVDCSEPHRMQITGDHLMPDTDEYPSDRTWTSLDDAACKTEAERFLDVPLDPYGRFAVRAIVPTPASWLAGERTAWCALGPWATGDDGLVAEDARTADQQFVFEVGECVARPPGQPPAVVPCDRPHHREVTGRIDVASHASPPTEDELSARCTGPTQAYLGGPPVEPWEYGYEILAPESWAAGARTVHCFVAQWDAAGEQIEVTTPARG